MTRPALLDTFTRSALDIQLLRISLILIFFGFGYTKWFDYEAHALIPLIANSPLLSWLHAIFGIHGASHVLGVAEWAIGAALLIGIWQPHIAVIGALGSAITYLTTLTLIMTTPGAWETSAGGFPAMGGATSFLVKDVVLLAASIALFKHELLRACPRTQLPPVEHCARPSVHLANRP